MRGDRYLRVEVAYEPELGYGRSLEWVAPELKHAGLVMTADHTNESRPSRTWAGVIGRATFERFARAWNIDYETDLGTSTLGTSTLGTSTEDGHQGRDYTFDGMNWEVGGESPIVYVAVNVSDAEHGAKPRPMARSPQGG